MTHVSHFRLSPDGRHEKLSWHDLRAAERSGLPVVSVTVRINELQQHAHRRLMTLAARAEQRTPATTFRATGSPARTTLS